MPVVDVAKSAANCQLFGSTCREGRVIVVFEMSGELAADIFPLGRVEIKPREAVANDLLPVGHLSPHES